MSKISLDRRAFLAATTTLAAAQVSARPNDAQVVPGRISPNEKLNIAAIGIGGMGGTNINNIEGQNFTALCDVDSDKAAGVFNRFPKAKKFADYRVMFEEAEQDFDAVLVATPDHTHGVIGMEALRRKKHLYMQKPLAHSLHEVRELTKAAREAGVQTQMGNQGHSSTEIRMLKEWIADGAVGEIREVYAWSDRPVGGDPWSDFPIIARPKEQPKIPASLDWDLWLGPAPFRAYHPVYHPMSWRGFWDFGTGALGDMGCHIIDPAFYAMDLGHPTAVQATTSHFEDGVEAECYPRACIVRYEFPARNGRPPVNLTWSDGRLLPPIPKCFESGRRLGGNGAIFVGEDAAIMHGSHGAGGLRIVPEVKMQAYKQPAATIPRVERGQGGHEMDWVRACKDGKPASSSFEYGGPLTEMVLLGVLAMRARDQRLEWDGENLRVTNNEAANRLITPEFRDWWRL